MAAALEDTDTRRRLLADLARELRTPLATLEGCIEGLDDGVVAAEPATWRTLAEALARLRRLVDAAAGAATRRATARRRHRPASGRADRPRPHR